MLEEQRQLEHWGLKGNLEEYANGNAELRDDSRIAGEIAGCEFTDVRLGKRLGSLLHQISGSIGGTVPLACPDWANMKAAYRFFSNDRVDEEAILAGHFQATRARAQASSGLLLILQDTTEFSCKRDKPELIGSTSETISRRDEAGRWRKHKVAIGDKSFTFARKQDAIAAEAALDGIYIIRISAPQAQMEAADCVRNYKALANVERAFRSLKTAIIR